MNPRFLLPGPLALVPILALSGILPLSRAHAQTHVVKKPETVVRAVAVYEWTGEEAKPKASRLVPVTLFINGHLEDAGVYLARPVPFALETGTIFELDKAGVPEATLELSFARHLQADQIDDGWMGFGSYKPLAKPVLVAAKKSGPLSKIEVSSGKPATGPKFENKSATKDAADSSSPDSDRPTMKRRADSDGKGTAGSDNANDPDSSTHTASPGKPGAGTSDDSDRPAMKRRSDPTASPAPEDDPDRPTLTRRSGSGAADPSGDSQPGSPPADKGAGRTGDDPQSASPADPNSEAERPTLRKRTDAQRQAARKEHDTSSVSGVGSLNDDPDRPSLHRGKSAGAMNADDLPALVGLPPDLQQRIAVSDAANRAQHDFTRAWTDEAERASVLQKLQILARARLAAYDSANLGPVVAKPPSAPARKLPPGTRARKTAPKPPLPAELKDEVLKAYTLSYGGAATYFYSASFSAADGATRYISLVAQQEGPGDADLKIALASATDQKHLDRTPQLRLVDVVDAEASNRASLLMELRSQSSRQFVLYRVIGAQAQQTFVTGSTE